MKSPAELAEAINNLNCHQRGEGYGPVTEAQIRMVVEEAQAELQSRVAELEKDRERLEWLEGDGRRCVKFTDGWNVWDQSKKKHTLYWIRPLLRQAIDAAIKGANDPQ